MKYVACYCRVSTDEQVKFGFSIQAQRDALEKYCKENKYKYEFYIDEGISASSMKRPALQEMLKKLNVFDMVIFTKLDRLSRNVLDANTINKMLIDNKCTMKAIDEDDIDTSTADGTFIFNLKVSLAQREIGKTSERIKFVFQSKREKGEITSGSKKYGYDIVNKHYVVNEIEAENLRNLFKYFIDVEGNLKDTYEYFIEHFPGKGYDALYGFLRNESYIGKYKMYRKNIYLDNYIPRIMDDDLFNKVQLYLQKKQYNISHKPSYGIFSGLLYCNECKSRMTKRQDNRVKIRTMRYICDNSSHYKLNSTEKKCNNNKNIREDYLEKCLINMLQEEIEKYIYKNTITNKKNVQVDNSKKILSIEKKIEKLKDLYLDNLISKEAYSKDYKIFTSKIEDLKKNQNMIVEEKKDYSKLTNLLKSDFKTLYYTLDLVERRQFWLNIVDKIYIEDAEIKEITFL